LACCELVLERADVVAVVALEGAEHLPVLPKLV
jgi:hypothetical protein